MPNHLHLLTASLAFADADGFKTVWTRFKGWSSRKIHQLMGSEGSFWQDSLYDRWVRNETEFRRWVAYIRNNPVKARLAERPGLSLFPVVDLYLRQSACFAPPVNVGRRL